MSVKYLGQPFDIHTGAIDLIPTHHNNEIAQSEAASGLPFVNYWVHNEFVSMGSEKMSKSLGNVVTIETLIENAISPLAYRYWLLTAHYRTLVNFTFESVKASQTALVRLMTTIRDYSEGGRIDEGYRTRFLEYINDDLNTPAALALTWELIKDPNISDDDKKATILDFDRVFGLKLATVPKVKEESIPPEITVLVEAREEARKNKEWEKADALRKEIEARGFSLEDSAEGVKVKAAE
jgi:cysteinyl-tRNA synthetase